MSELVDVDVNFASAEYFRAMYIPAIEGRLFGPQDERPDSDAVIVNEALALRYFAGRATGQTLIAADGRAVTIIGSVQTRSYRTFEGAQRPMVYFPISRSIARVFYAALRLRPNPAQTEPDIAAALAAAGEREARGARLRGVPGAGARAGPAHRNAGRRLRRDRAWACTGRRLRRNARCGAAAPPRVRAARGTRGRPRPHRRRAGRSHLTPAAAGIAAGVKGAMLLPSCRIGRRWAAPG